MDPKDRANLSAAGPWPEIDANLYERVLRAVLPEEEVEYILRTESGDGDEGGWFGISLSQNPMTLGLLTLSEPFATWYAAAFPGSADLVAEIRALPEEQAIERIRGGEWLG